MERRRAFVGAQGGPLGSVSPEGASSAASGHAPLDDVLFAAACTGKFPSKGTVWDTWHPLREVVESPSHWGTAGPLCPHPAGRPARDPNGLRAELRRPDAAAPAEVKVVWNAALGLRLGTLTVLHINLQGLDFNGAQPNVCKEEEHLMAFVFTTAREVWAALAPSPPPCRGLERHSGGVGLSGAGLWHWLGCGA